MNSSTEDAEKMIPGPATPPSHVELHRLLLDPGLDLIQLLGVAGHRAGNGFLFTFDTIDFDDGVFVLEGGDLEGCLCLVYSSS